MLCWALSRKVQKTAPGLAILKAEKRERYQKRGEKRKKFRGRSDSACASPVFLKNCLSHKKKQTVGSQAQKGCRPWREESPFSKRRLS